MNTALFCLTLASLLLAPALCKDEEQPEDYIMFRVYHTHFLDRAFDCTFMRTRGWTAKKRCIPSSSIILGDASDRVEIDGVLSICRGQGTPMGDKLFKSDKKFRVGRCRLKDRDAVRPNCDYKLQIETGQITVGCSQGFPVHLKA